MDDLINRQAAIDLVKDVCEAILSMCGSHYDGEDEVYDDLREAYAILKCNKEIRVALRHMPSAQPEKHTDERTETHACDCISREAAIDAIDKYSVWVMYTQGDSQNDEAELVENIIKQTKKAIQSMLREDLPSAQPEPKWIPVTKKAHPDLPIRVQVQMDNGWIITAYYQEGEWLSVPDCGESIQDKWIEAWRELPEPYKERDINGQSN